MVVKMYIISDFTAAELNKHLNKLRGSPWSSERRPKGGFKWFHERCSGNLRIRRTELLRTQHKRIYVTAVGKDEAKLISEFIEWILTHFREKLLEMRIEP